MSNTVFTNAQRICIKGHYRYIIYKAEFQMSTFEKQRIYKTSEVGITEIIRTVLHS